MKTETSYSCDHCDFKREAETSNDFAVTMEVETHEKHCEYNPARVVPEAELYPRPMQDIEFGSAPGPRAHRDDILDHRPSPTRSRRGWEPEDRSSPHVYSHGTTGACPSALAGQIGYKPGWRKITWDTWRHCAAIPSLVNGGELDFGDEWAEQSCRPSGETGLFDVYLDGDLVADKIGPLVEKLKAAESEDSEKEKIRHEDIF